MYSNYAIIFIIAVCSILSAMEVDCIKHKKFLFWKISFYFSAYLFIPSFMKYLLGYRKENLLDCFWNPRLITLVHYGIPLLIIAVIVPIILKILFKDNIIDIIRYFDSSLYFVLSLAFVLVRKINNKIYCMVFAIAVVATLMAVLLKKTKAVYAGVADIKNRIIESAPIFVCYFMTVVIYTPNELYLYNASDFPISYWYFFGKLLAAGVIVTIILLGGTLLYLNQVHIKLYLTVMFVLLTAGYIQGMFLNGNMAVLDGTADNSYDKSRIYINLIIWIIIAATVIIFTIKKSNVAERFMKVISIWITLIQLVSLAVIIISSDETAPKGEMALTTEGMLEVGEKNNIIVFILDKFDGSYVDEILEETPDFFEPLNDFVSYENATSMFCPTFNSIPYLLTGVEYRGGVYMRHMPMQTTFL